MCPPLGAFLRPLLVELGLPKVGALGDYSIRRDRGSGRMIQGDMGEARAQPALAWVSERRVLPYQGINMRSKGQPLLFVIDRKLWRNQVYARVPHLAAGDLDFVRREVRKRLSNGWFIFCEDEGATYARCAGLMLQWQRGHIPERYASGDVKITKASADIIGAVKDLRFRFPEIKEKAFLKIVRDVAEHWRSAADLSLGQIGAELATSVSQLRFFGYSFFACAFKISGRDFSPGYMGLCDRHLGTFTGTLGRKDFKQKTTRNLARLSIVKAEHELVVCEFKGDSIVVEDSVLCFQVGTSSLAKVVADLIRSMAKYNGDSQDEWLAEFRGDLDAALALREEAEVMRHSEAAASLLSNATGASPAMGDLQVKKATPLMPRRGAPMMGMQSQQMPASGGISFVSGQPLVSMPMAMSMQPGGMVAGGGNVFASGTVPGVKHGTRNEHGAWNEHDAWHVQIVYGWSSRCCRGGDPRDAE